MKKEFAIGALLFVIVGLAAATTPSFRSPQNIKNQTELIGMYGIFSIGCGIVIITGGIDLSVGSVFALEGVFLSRLLMEWHWPWALAALAVIAGVVGLGVIHGILITMARIQAFIVTLCGLLVYRSLARYFADEESKGFGASPFGILRPLARGHLGSVPSAFIVLMVIAVIMYVVLHRSVYGRYLFAVGRNEEAARYSGINTKLVVGSAYALSMLLASISGIMFAFQTNSVSPSLHGSFYELYGIAAAVLGGCSLRGGEGSIIGIVFGTVLLLVLQNLITLRGIEPALSGAVIGTVILIAVLMDEIGLKGLLQVTRFVRRFGKPSEVRQA